MRDYKNVKYLVIIFLIVVSFVAFGRIAGNDFINFDDEGYITENNHIKSGINPESIKWAFQTVVLDNWVPLALLSHMLDWSSVRSKRLRPSYRQSAIAHRRRNLSVSLFI